MIRISDIFKPSSKEVRVIGNVSKISDSKRFSQPTEFLCRNCGWHDSIELRFPYENFIHPHCPGCNNGRMEILPPRGKLLTWHKIHLQEMTTSFELELVSDMSPPKKGQTISFITRIHPKMKGRKITITTWTGESSRFSVEAN